MRAVIGARTFKVKCLKLLDEVMKFRKPLLITRHGKPVARLVSIEPECSLFGALKGSVVSETDIISPVEAKCQKT